MGQMEKENGRAIDLNNARKQCGNGEYGMGTIRTGALNNQERTSIRDTKGVNYKPSVRHHIYSKAARSAPSPALGGREG